MHSFTRSGSKTAVATFLALAFLVAACGSSSDSSSSSGSSGGAAASSTDDAAAVLGTPNKATGSPIKIGYITDGATSTIDDAPTKALFNGTVQYINDYLGGINGHVMVIDSCTTEGTPTGGTQCGTQMVTDKVAAVLTVVSAVDAAVFAPIKDAGIPYVTYTAVTADIILSTSAFELANALGIVVAPLQIALDKGLKSVGQFIPDIPAATGPVKALATPLYGKQGVAFDLIAVSGSVADVTPQVQQAISNGDQVMSVGGSEQFIASVLKALKQLAFTGPIVIGGTPTKGMVDAVPGGLEGMYSIVNTTTDPTDADVKLYNAVSETYAKGVEPEATSPNYFATPIAFVRALTGVTSAVDAPSIMTALQTMPQPVPLPLGQGITFQCGSKPVSFAPAICSSDVLQSTLDAEGVGHDFKILNVGPLLVL